MIYIKVMTIYISIGYNCDPRTYMRYNLNISKNNGYRSCPFDLCITPYESLIQCLQTDFRHFFDNMHTIWGDNAGGDRSRCQTEGHQNITNAYQMIFNHEGSTHAHLFTEGKDDDEFYIRNNFQEFRKRYSRRIQNFLDYIKENDDITLIHSGDGDLAEILHLMRQKYPGKVFHGMKI